MHRGFSHPTAEKLYDLLKVAKPDEVDSETKKVLDEISKYCEICQRNARPPLRFKVTIPTKDNLKFCEEVSMDLMFLDGKAVLHVIDTATRFSAATFLDSHGQNYGQSTEGIWLAFLEIWCIPYLGYPNRMRTDQGETFMSNTWRQLCEQNGITPRLPEVQAHSSLVIGEKYHDPLRRILKKQRWNTK